MSEVLVLIDHAEGAVRKPTYELLTIAKRLGEPSAVFIGPADKAGEAVEAVKKYGAAKVYTVDDSDIKGYLVAPKAEALQQLAEKTSPSAILISSSFEGKEIAGRLAIKLESGLITDAVDVQEGAGDHPVGVRRQLHGAGEGHQGHADHRGQAERRCSRGVRRRR